MTETHRIQGGLSAVIKADGAELCAIQDGQGRDLLWDAGPAWPSHSPVLFPIIGQLSHDRLLVDGTSYPMTRHGFARRRRFAWLERGPDHCRLELRDDAETRAVFPFPFHLVLTYRIEAGVLHVEYSLANPGPAILPASLGAHPAFRWPLHGGMQADHRIEFAAEEPAPIHRLDQGLLGSRPHASPVQGRILPLRPSLFEQDAIIMLQPASRSLRYLGPDGGLEIAWEGFTQLGLWQKPGGAFLCIEPWQGYSSPLGWDDDIRGKPGIMHVAPGEVRCLSWSLRPLPPGE